MVAQVRDDLFILLKRPPTALGDDTEFLYNRGDQDLSWTLRPGNKKGTKLKLEQNPREIYSKTDSMLGEYKLF